MGGGGQGLRRETGNLIAAGRHPAQRRLAFEELLAHQLAMQQLKARVKQESAAPLPDGQGLEARVPRLLDQLQGLGLVGPLRGGDLRVALQGNDQR